MTYHASTYITSEKFNRANEALSPQFKFKTQKEQAKILGLTSYNGYSCCNVNEVFGTYRFDFGDDLYMDFEINTDNGRFYTVLTVWSPKNHGRTMILKNMFNRLCSIENPEIFEFQGSTYEFGFVIDPAFDSDVDEFYIDNENERITQLYYNPDSTAGGQWVENILTSDDILGHQNFNTQDFFDLLECECTQYCHDIGSYDFHDYVKMFEGPSDFSSAEYSLEEIKDKLIKWAESFVESQPRVILKQSPTEIISAREHNLEISGEREDIKCLVEILQQYHPEGTLGDLLYKLDKEVDEEFRRECDEE